MKDLLINMTTQNPTPPPNDDDDKCSDADGGSGGRNCDTGT